MQSCTSLNCCPVLERCWASHTCQIVAHSLAHVFQSILFLIIWICCSICFSDSIVLLLFLLRWLDASEKQKWNRHYSIIRLSAWFLRFYFKYVTCEHLQMDWMWQHNQHQIHYLFKVNDDNNMGLQRLCLNLCENSKKEFTAEYRVVLIQGHIYGSVSQ